MRRLLVPTLTALAVLAALAGPAGANCHEFTVSVDNAQPTEGESVRVTVTRGGNLRSSVRVRTQDGPDEPRATAGQDYSVLNEELDFSGATDSRSLVITTTQSIELEDDEMFSVFLENPQGCPGNNDFELSHTRNDPLVITILDSFTLPAPEPEPSPSPTPSPSPSPSPTPTEDPEPSPPPAPSIDPSAIVTPADSPVPVPTRTATLAVDDGNGNGGIGLGRIIQLILLLFLLGAAALVFFAWRGRIRE